LKKLLHEAKSRRGTTSVEFALLAAPILISLIGAADGLRYVYTRQALQSYASQGFRTMMIAAESQNDNTCSPFAANMFSALQVPIGLAQASLQATPSCSFDKAAGTKVLTLTVSYEFTFLLDVFGALEQTIPLIRIRAI
jgi:Flp pilus assembly protein TadG